MSTPHRRGWLFPASADKKGKGGVFSPEIAAPGKTDASPIKSLMEAYPSTSLEDSTAVITRGSEAEVWRRFRDVGALDENSIEKKDRVALAMHVSKMEAELYDYQYNMGLLLMERKDWESKHEKLKAALLEADEKLKMELAANLIAISKAEKHEEYLKKALAVEKQCVADLEEALKEMRAEVAELKVTAENKLVEAKNMILSTEEKSLLADSKLHAAEALEGEVTRKNADAERKLQEIEAREDAMRREQHSVRVEHEARESDFNRERQNLRDWETRLQEGEKKLLEDQRILSHREEHTNKKEETLKQLEKDLQDRKEHLKKEETVLQQSEADLKARMASLIVREENAAKREISIRRREQELLLLQENLINREQKQEDLEAKAKAVEDKDHYLQNRQKQLDLERKAVIEERDILLVLKGEIEILRKQLEEEKKQIHEERENLKVLEREREDLLKMQRCLKEEIDDCRMQTRVVNIQTEELNKEREKFEREWDMLDEKMEQVRKELEQSELEKRRVAKWLENEETRLKQEKHSLSEQISREAEALRIEKEAFVNSVEHERKEWFAKVEKEKEDLVRDIDVRKRDMERALGKRKEDLEREIKVREQKLKKEIEKEKQNLATLKATAEKELQDAHQIRKKVVKERDEIAKAHDDLEKYSIEIRKDIDELSTQREKLKEQREALKIERFQILEAEQIKKKINKELMVAELSFKTEQLSQKTDEQIVSQKVGFVSQQHTNGAASELGQRSEVHDIRKSPTTPGKSLATSGRLSWLQKCASALFYTPEKKLETTNMRLVTGIQHELAATLHTSEADCQIDQNMFHKCLVDESNQSVDPSKSYRSFTLDQLNEVENCQHGGLSWNEGTLNADTVDAVIEDAKLIPDSSTCAKGVKQGISNRIEAEKLPMTEDNYIGVNAAVSNIPANFEHCKHESLTKQGRKLQHQQQSKESLGEQDADGEETEPGIALSGTRKRKREVRSSIKAAQEKDVLGAKRYNLRHSTISSKETVQGQPQTLELQDVLPLGYLNSGPTELQGDEAQGKEKELEVVLEEIAE